jgi:hypothetical protein
MTRGVVKNWEQVQARQSSAVRETCTREKDWSARRCPLRRDSISLCLVEALSSLARFATPAPVPTERERARAGERARERARERESEREREDRCEEYLDISWQDGLGVVLVAGRIT